MYNFLLKVYCQRKLYYFTKLAALLYEYEFRKNRTCITQKIMHHHLIWEQRAFTLRVLAMLGFRKTLLNTRSYCYIFNIHRNRLTTSVITITTGFVNHQKENGDFLECAHQKTLQLKRVYVALPSSKLLQFRCLKRTFRGILYNVLYLHYLKLNV